MSETANTITRNQRKERTGEVVSSKMQKTIVVSVKRRFPHPQFKKVVTSFKKFYAHDEKSEAKVGDAFAGFGDYRFASRNRSQILGGVVHSTLLERGAHAHVEDDLLHPRHLMDVFVFALLDERRPHFLDVFLIKSGFHTGQALAGSTAVPRLAARASNLAASITLET